MTSAYWFVQVGWMPDAVTSTLREELDVKVLVDRFDNTFDTGDFETFGVHGDGVAAGAGCAEREAAGVVGQSGEIG